MKEKTTKDKIKETVVPILKKHNVKRASLFGSIVSGNYTDKSDIDILVELDDGLSLLDFIDIKLEIEDATKRKVDLVEYATIKPSLKKYILKQQEDLF
ncbi:MAG: Nucleotidyltransferase domain protein [Candidatus Methanofastidiosum methylothiophilum]|uniref:Nucleotidyltransferase domain protein n=1 Tax=Candidatus Methanofastidiosum methylothiophilum TaxID=1705564 RepID=A0A150IHT6_9EURY|nr:MAG: Nucleotidyltransferase domain protein [Candidatus Methanofastidiosum methylthiophilus]KYC46695.1 MAG: Nucleotidyltransferase domain protein [Candidatus Methanofastidiosum methylthiophilus]KYC49135.1 MAG: Nucleotidyltransferase domain protein [Candidatus Methanofastidiosum methylthiophilus]